MKVSSSRVSWYVDSVLIRTEKRKIPAGPFQLYLNIWAPAADWAAAYNPAIQPTAEASQNQRFSMDVDSVLVRSVVAPAR